MTKRSLIVLLNNRALSLDIWRKSVDNEHSALFLRQHTKIKKAYIMHSEELNHSRAERAGLWYGLLGVLSFSLTLPATRVAVAYLDPTVVGLGRALVAAVLAAVLLAATRQRWPTRAEVGGLAIVIAGVIFGFPFLSDR